MSDVLESRVIKVVESTIADPSKIGKIAADTKFVEDLQLDSMDVVELIVAMEEEFSDDGGDNPLEISDEDAQKFITVSDVVEYLKSHGVSG